MHDHFDFDGERFDRQARLTRGVRVGLVASIAVGWFTASLPGIGETIWPMGLLGVGLVGWLVANAVSGVTARQVIGLTGRVATEPPSMQLLGQIEQTARRFTLYPAVRVMIYHQWAVVLHRQQRFDASARVALTLLSIGGRGLDVGTRHRVLIMLADSCLHRGDLWGAYGTLCDLYASRLDLPGALQLLELQTRYQSMCGQRDALLGVLRQKVAMSELMPPAASAAMHRSYAAAARHAGCLHTAKWLDDRAMLLWPHDAPPSATLDRMLTPIDALGLADQA